jgi:NADH-quinone oxidoreductase subunit N
LYTQIQSFLEKIFKQTSSILPELVLVFGLVVLLLFAILKKKNTLFNTIVYGAILISGIVASFYLPQENVSFIEFKRLILISALLVPIVFPKPLFLEKSTEHAEWLFLMLASSLGLMMMISATDWMILFVALELAAIASYILVILSWKKDSYEGAIKYLLFGVLSSAIMLYGVSWLYGFVGTFSLEALLTIHFKNDVLLYVAFFMAVAGVLMKISAVPWHIWTPDAYQIAPVPVVAFLSVAPKIAGLIALYKIIQAYSNLISEIETIIGIVAMMSIIWGNLVAFWQKNIKRMLAYSSIAQIGYMLIGVVMGVVALNALWFYLCVYFVATFLIFTLVEHYEKQYQITEIIDFKGIGQKDIWGMGTMMAGLITLAGLPPTAGFTAKLLIFSALWENYNLKTSDISLWWIIIGLINTVVGLFYYLKIPYYAFLKETQKQILPIPRYLMWVCIAFSFLLILLFIKPSMILG